MIENIICPITVLKDTDFSIYKDRRIDDIHIPRLLVNAESLGIPPLGF